MVEDVTVVVHGEGVAVHAQLQVADQGVFRLKICRNIYHCFIVDMYFKM